MKSVKYSQDIFLLASPLFASFLFNLSPSLAATFSFSEAGVFTDNFSNLPQSILTYTNTSTLAIATNSSVTAEAIASAVFYSNLGISQDYSLSNTSGLGSNYFGLAQSYSELGGFNFSIQPKESFSFDFSAFLNLQTTVDSNQTEQAIASGNISFILFDSTNQDSWSVLDYFQIFGDLSSSEHTSQITFNKSSDAFIYSESTLSNLSGDNKSPIQG
jgi:hypothetical protein